MEKKYFNINENTKIYAIAPAGVVTGGVELIHQFVDLINRQGGEAYIVYNGENPHHIPDDYKKYKILLADSIEDVKDNILVLSEVNVRKVRDFHNIQIMIWWMSVDNYFFHHQGDIIDNFKFDFCFGLKRFAKRLLKVEKTDCFSIKEIKNNMNIKCNAYQSEYAADFLRRNKIYNIYPVKDYINNDYVYIENKKNKENIILYNPKKGFKFTRKLIKKAPELHWVPIQNMTRNQVKEMMNRAKLYIDFGNFPGKDRMPREAAMSGCCIVTGKLGAAKFYDDLAIDESKYKYNQKKASIKEILNKIRYILSNYETVIDDFDTYRTKTSLEKSEFEKSVISLFIE